MKHRHRLAERARQRPRSPSRRAEVYEEMDEQPQPSRTKKPSTHHMRAEGGKTKHRLDKFRRGARRTKRFDDGGVATGAGSTRDDPGNEIAGADRDRPKSTLERLGRELMGPKSAYARGGRQKPRGYDVGGAAPSIYSPPTQADFINPPKPNYVASLVKNAGQLMPSQPRAAPSFPGSPSVPSVTMTHGSGPPRPPTISQQQGLLSALGNGSVSQGLQTLGSLLPTAITGPQNGAGSQGMGGWSLSTPSLGIGQARGGRARKRGTTR